MVRQSPSVAGSRLGALGMPLPGPGPHRARERAPGAVVDHPPHRPEDRPLQRQGHGELGKRDVAVLGLRRILLVDQRPDPLEDRLAGEGGDEPGGHADGDEQNSFHPLVLPAEREAETAEVRPLPVGRYFASSQSLPTPTSTASGGAGPEAGHISPSPRFPASSLSAVWP